MERDRGASAAGARRRRVARIALVCVSCGSLALSLRVPHLSESLWLDELHTAWVATGPFDQIARRAALGNQAPVYFVAEWLIARAATPSETTLRIASLVLGVALIAVTGFLAYHATRSTAWGFLAACAGAIDSHWVFYSVEARPYAAVQFLGLLHGALFVRQMRGGAGWAPRAAHVITGGLMFWFHYTASLLLAAEGVAALVLLVRSRRSRAIAASVVGQLILIGAIGSPALPHLAAIASRAPAWSELGAPGSPWKILDMLHGGAYAIPLLVIFVWDSILRQLRLTNEGDSVRDARRSNWAALSVWIAPPVLAWLVARHAGVPIFMNRYVAAASAAPILLAARLAGQLDSALPRRIAVIAFACSTLYVNHVRLFQWNETPAPPRTEDWRAMIHHLNRMRGEERRAYPILVRAGLIETDAPEGWARDTDESNAYLTFPLRSIYPLEPPADPIPIGNASDFTLPPAELALVAEAGGAWLVVRGPPRRGTDYAARLAELLGEPWRTVAHHVHGTVQLLRVEPINGEPVSVRVETATGVRTEARPSHRTRIRADGRPSARRRSWLRTSRRPSVRRASR
ncbi:MAG: hypothetical protein FJ297_02815 [Planctomycetes bacterium]|nr:hypothetical protein [Planctomycetota bacterium]